MLNSSNVEGLRVLNISTYISGQSNMIESKEAYRFTPPCTVSSTMFLMYDYLLMLASEVEYMWRVKWGVGKVLYMLSRYPLLFIMVMGLYWTTGNVVSGPECRALYSASGYAWVLSTWVAEVILTIRVWALWHRRMWLAVYSAFAAVANATIALVDVVKAVESVTYVSDSGSIESASYPRCLTVNEGGRSTYVAYIVLVLHGAFVFLLMVTVWYKSFHHSVHFSAMMYTFYTDGVVYFAAILAISIANMIFNLTQPPEYMNFLLPTQAAMHSVLSTRMLLNLRRSAQSDLRGVNSILDPDIGHRVTNISRLRFAAGDDSVSAC
ncbi:hypothetical protein AB1N83_010358 [Pleurotus pulmonarius]